MTMLIADDIAQVGLRERQRRSRNEAILEAAFGLIAEKGYEAMTMDDLAERVGISKPTLYHHFDSKEAIAVRALVRLNESAVLSIRSMDPKLQPVERLERVLRWMVENRFSPTPAAFVRARPALTPARSHPDYLLAMTHRVEAVTEIIEEAQAANQIDPRMSSKLLAQILFGLACNIEYDDVVATGDASPNEIADAVVRVFFDGIRIGK